MLSPRSSYRKQNDRPRRPAKTPEQIRRRRKFDAIYAEKSRIPLHERILYAFITSLLFGLAGVLIDLLITLARSIIGSGDGSVFWLFTPLLLVIGALIGAFSSSHAGADGMTMVGASLDPHLDEISIKYEILRGLGIGIFLFALIWLLLLILA